MTKRKIVYLDLLYTLLTVALFSCQCWLVDRPPVNNSLLILSSAIFGIMLFIIGGALFGKLLITIFFFSIGFYLCKHFTIVLLLIITLNVIYIYLYVKYRTNYYDLKLTYRLSGVFLLFIAFSLNNEYQKKIEAEDDGFSINLTNSDFYYYHHFKIGDNTPFIERFGMLSYLNKNIFEIVDKTIYKSEYTEVTTNFVNREELISPNKYSGLFANRSLLLIQSTSLYDCYISEKYTPNIYKIINEGLYFGGFHNTISRYGSVDAEFMTNVSLYPYGRDGCESYLYDYLNYEETLAKAFTRNGYSSLMVLNDYKVYYNRERMYRTYGYSDIITPYNIGLDGRVSNTLFSEQLVYNLLKPGNNFVYYVSLDIPLDNQEIALSLKQEYPFASESDLVKILSLIDLDLALGNILNTIEKSNLQDRIVIALYGCDDNLTQSALDFSNMVQKSNNSIMCIYNNVINNQYSKTSSSLDILPTFANLFGIEICNKKIIGRDIFDENYKGMQLSTFHEYTYHWKNGDQSINYWNFKSELELEDIDDMKERLRFSYFWLKYSKYFE